MLSGKSFVIIGGTTGIGLSAAHAFVHAGARVVIVGRDPAHLAAAQEEIGKSVVGIEGDACRPGTAEEAIELSLTRHGAFDGIYHVAGGSGRKSGDGPLHELTDQGWNATLEWNLTSTMFSNRAAVRHFRANRRPGTILNMSSVLGWSPSPAYFATHAYAAAKAAIIGFTKAIAATYASENIRANVIAPALVETPMSARASHDDAILHFIHTKQPLDGGRIAQPEDLDGAAVYLMSEHARFVTGQVLSVDGGWSLSDGQLA
ncbi:MAG TPA: SDR family oxidoreductase [Chthoniobacteraceae bacterium]|nr:SDR family oxidoreductase [Chthoniobacteraceae bacterium]